MQKVLAVQQESQWGYTVQKFLVVQQESQWGFTLLYILVVQQESQWGLPFNRVKVSRSTARNLHIVFYSIYIV